MMKKRIYKGSFIFPRRSHDKNKPPGRDPSPREALRPPAAVYAEAAGIYNDILLNLVIERFSLLSLLHVDLLICKAFLLHILSVDFVNTVSLEAESSRS